ncbi:Uncharacterized protein HZ326_6906 [Fusarium oxysporum f. sp. albedinis]|nr:Uncharacterized protein HZ326_6906 [Fusarium oxysporum f. sp. albedinis]
MPQIGPIDAFMNDIWDHGHIDVASTQHNATLLVPVTIHTIAATADADTDAAGVCLMFHRACGPIMMFQGRGQACYGVWRIASSIQKVAIWHDDQPSI